MMFAEITTLVENLHHNTSNISRDLEAQVRDIFQAVGVDIRAPPGVVWTPKLIPSLPLLLSDPLAGMPATVDVSVVTRLFPDGAAATQLVRHGSGVAQLLAPAGEREVPLRRLLMFSLLTCSATTEAKLRLGFWLLDSHLRSEVDAHVFVDAMADACLAIRAATCQQLLQQGQVQEVEKVQAPGNTAFVLALAQGIAGAAIRHVGTHTLDFGSFRQVLRHISKSISSILMASLNYKVQVHHASQKLGSFSPSRSLDGGPLSCDEDEASSQLRSILCSFVKRSRMVDRFLEDRTSGAGVRSARELGKAGSRQVRGSGALYGSTSGGIAVSHSGQFDPSGTPMAVADRIRRSSKLSADPSSPSVADDVFEDVMEEGQIISTKRRSIVLPRDSVCGTVTRRGGHLALSIPPPSSTTNEAASPRSGPASVASGMSQMSATSKERNWANPVSRFFALPRSKSRGTSLPIVRGSGVAMAQLQGQTIISKSCQAPSRDTSRSPSPTRLTFDSVGINRYNTPPSAASQQERLAQYIGALPLVGGSAPPRTSSNDNSCVVTLSPPASAGVSGTLPHHHAQVSMTSLPCPDFSPLPPPDPLSGSTHKSLSFISVQSGRVGSPASLSSPLTDADSHWASIIGTPQSGDCSASPTTSAVPDALWRITENKCDVDHAAAERASRESVSWRGDPAGSSKPMERTPSDSATAQQRLASSETPVAASMGPPAPTGPSARAPVYSTDTSMASPPSSAMDAMMGPTPRTPFEIEPLSAQGLVEARDHAAATATPKTSDSSIRFPTPVSADNKTTPEPFLPMKSVVPEGVGSEEDADGGVKIRVTVDDSVSRDITVDDKLSRLAGTYDEDLMADTDIDTLLQEYTQALEDLKATLVAAQARPDDSFALFASTLKFAGTIGGKIFILGSMRLLLSITLVFFDVVIFLVLFQVVKLNPVISLASVVGINVFIALILLLLVLRSTKGPEGLSTVLAGQTNNPIVDSLPPQFRPMLDNVMRHVRSMGEEVAAQKAVAEGARTSDGERPSQVRVSKGSQDDKQLPEKLLDIVSQWADRLPDKHKDLKLVKVIQEAVHDLQDRQQKRRSTAEHPAAPYTQRNVRFFMDEPDEQDVPTDGMRINKASTAKNDINFAPTHASKRSITGGRMASVKRA